MYQMCLMYTFSGNWHFYHQLDKCIKYILNIQIRQREISILHAYY